MKKIYAVIILLAAIVVAQPAQAQVNIGLRGGLNISNMSLNKDVFDVSNRAGFFIGPSLKLGFGSIGADISALYDQREAKVDEETIKQKNIVIPINARVNIGLGAASVFLAAGPQFGFNIGDKDKTWGDVKNTAAKWTLKSSNVSANVGIGATILSKLQLKVNYNIALGKTGEVDIKEGADAAWKTITGAKANAWQVSAAYYF
jgi:hypothetical protein